MAILCSSVPSLSLKKVIIPSKPSLISPHSNHLANFFQTMSSALMKPEPRSSPSAAATIHQVPGLDYDEIDRIAEETFQRYSTSPSRISRGGGIAIVWFRNDLRVLDNEALYEAWLSSHMVLPVYCVDPRLFGTTYYFGFPKTGGMFLSWYLLVLMVNFLCKRGIALYTPKSMTDIKFMD